MPTLTLECIHCGLIPLTDDADLRAIAHTGLLKGIQCFICHEEAWVQVDGVRVSVREASKAAAAMRRQGGAR